MNRSAQQRALLTCILLACCFTGFSFRLVHLQVSRHGELAQRAANQNVVRETIFAKRGLIQDVHGEALAENEPRRIVFADGSLITDPAALVTLLAGPLKMSGKELLERLTRKRFDEQRREWLPARYVVLKRNVPEQIATGISETLAAQKLRGIYFDHDTARIYPNGAMLCHVLGYLNEEAEGMEGIERSMSRYLEGSDGFRFIERDRTGKELVPYRGQERPPRDGATVRLTIDMGLQAIVESELDAAIKQYQPKKAIVILMRPQTGEILALANRPHYDLNQQQNVAAEARKNIAIMDMVEPGSTFKVVTVAAALNERIVRPETMIFCENRYWSWCRLRDHHAYGNLSVRDVLVRSSNIGVAKLGMQLGDQKFYGYVRRFGFGERSGVALPGEIPGIVHPPHTWSKISITRLPMGHEVGATPLQIALATCAIANGGKLMFPQIIREILDGEGRSIATFPPQEVRRVISKEAVAAVREAMIEVVGPKGTAERAKVAGYTVAGKTGTAQKLEASGSYAHDRHVVSFAGFLPAENPAFVGLVLLDEPQTKAGQYYGGLVAAPVFSRIGERVARYLNLVPTPEETFSSAILTATGAVEHRR